MNKKHWNTVIVNKALNDSGFLELVDHSYQLVLNSIPKSKRL
ncbi:MAG: MmcQ/YjbR family DNA-binding protein [Cyclobacteriaceae bacterium]